MRGCIRAIGRELLEFDRVANYANQTAAAPLALAYVLEGVGLSSGSGSENDYRTLNNIWLVSGVWFGALLFFAVIAGVTSYERERAVEREMAMGR